MTELRGLTIGAGFFSGIQMQAWDRVDGAAITAVCDTDEHPDYSAPSMYSRQSPEQIDRQQRYDERADNIEEEKKHPVRLQKRHVSK